MKLVSSNEVLRTKIFWVTEDHAVDPSGFEIERAIVRHPGSAVMMPVDGKGRVLLVRQYRLPARQYLWEMPAGKLDPGETALKAAKRELEEETGLKARKWTRMTRYYASPGFVDELMTIFLAEDLTQGTPEPMEDEHIETRWFPAKEVDAMIRGGKILDGKTLIGFLTWKRYHATRKTSAAKPERGG
jgi:ADP-ribose pyrophosphatase